MQNRNTIITLILLALGLLALSQMAQAVSPAPDGGYAGGNTAEGQNALLSLSTGTYNTAVGFLSLRSNTVGRFNTGVGAGALFSNVGNQNTGFNNTATGAGALLSNTTGVDNTANGVFALFRNTIAIANTAVGARALQNNDTTGNGVANNNTAVGSGALNSNINAFDNTAVGAIALEFNDSSGNVLAIDNTAVGSNALNSNIDGGGNTAVGAFALEFNDFNGTGTADDNTALGSAALINNINAAENTAVGSLALHNNDLSGNNTAIANTAIGYKAGFNQTDGSNNVYIGADIQGVAGESDTCRIKSIFGQTAANGSAVFITSGNKLGTDTSSKRFKEDIKPMDKASEALLALRPVTFRYKKAIDPEAKSQFGLVAEDVEKVSPDLVVRDREGKPYSVRYDQVNAMLLNEFLKEHKIVEQQNGKLESQARKIQEEQTIITHLQKEMETVIAHSKEQDSQIQRVSAQLDRSRLALQTVVENTQQPTSSKHSTYTGLVGI